MTTKQKLELTWIGKENRPRLEPRILLEDPSKSYHAEHRVTKNDIFDNRLIFGDNLLALKALEQDYAGKVKCIFIDPPYNTGNAFDHYDDGLEHSLWLSLMRDRLEILRKLLLPEGVLLVQIDDNEMAYLKVLLDELFGRQNYLNTIVVNTKVNAGASGGGEDKRIKKNNEFILLYAKNKEVVDYNQVTNLKPIDKYIAEHKETGIGFYYTRILYDEGVKKLVQEKDGMKIYEHYNYVFKTINEVMKQENLACAEAYLKYFEKIFMVTNAQTSLLTKVNNVINRKGVLSSYEYIPVTGRFKGEKTNKFIWNETLVVWLKDSAVKMNQGVYKKELKGTSWDDISWGRLDLEGGVDFKNGKKPEALIQRILEMCTNSNDLILDSFAGSGTTGAVAHKMGRRWIMVELGEHCHTHIIPRLKKLIDGEDEGGISKAVNWKGGGGFRYYKVAPSLLEKDKWGNWIINKEYNAAMLAEAVCKLEGFTYSPSDSLYWMHGKSTETDFIYVTTQNLSRDQLSLLSDEVGSERTLLVMCSAFRAKAEDFLNLTIKKIPNSVLSKCEWAHDDYSLQVENLPSAPKPVKSQMDLFDGEDE